MTSTAMIDGFQQSNARRLRLWHALRAELRLGAMGVTLEAAPVAFFQH